MQDNIENLRQQIELLREQRNSFKINTDHGTPDQTRSILIRSVFNQSISNIEAAINQLEILEYQLY
jgi:hypothetical protein